MSRSSALRASSSVMKCNTRGSMPVTQAIDLALKHMIFAAFAPSMWRRLVHPVLEAFHAKGEVAPHALPGALPTRFEQGAHVH